MYSIYYLEQVYYSMSSSDCGLLTCIQISQEAGQVVWYSHLFQSFPQFIVIHTVKCFGIVNKEEIDVFRELFCFFDDPADIRNLISGSLKAADWTFGGSQPQSSSQLKMNGTTYPLFGFWALRIYKQHEWVSKHSTAQHKYTYITESRSGHGWEEIPHVQGKQNPSKLVGAERRHQKVNRLKP